MERFEFNPKDGQTILEPEGKGAGYWIGAPHIYFDKGLNKFFLYVRTRNPRPKIGKVHPLDVRRGYKCQIFESIDGHNFKPIWEMRKHKINAKSIEGAALIKIKDKYHMFLSYESHTKIPRWKTFKAIANHPSEFKPEDFQDIKWDVPNISKLSIKDPLIIEDKGKYYLYIDYYRFYKKPWGSTAVLSSVDGNSFKWRGDIFVIPKKCTWMSHLMRLTSIFKDQNTYYGFFDGTDDKSMVCDEKSGIARGQTPYKLRIFSCEKPSYFSEYGKGSVRYLFGMKHEERLWIYYEYTEEQGEHVLKLYKI
jgi:hypothetical protein